MSIKVGVHNISAKLKNGKIAVKMQRTRSVELSFPLADYPGDTHPLDRRAWLMEAWRRDTNDGIFEYTPETFAFMSRVCDAAIKEIEAVLTKGVTK